MPDDETPAALDLDDALEKDSIAALKRERAELSERLEAADSKECPSCRASFERGTGVPENAEGKKKPAAKKSAAKKPAEKDESKDEREAEADEREKEDEDGFGFF